MHTFCMNWKDEGVTGDTVQSSLKEKLRFYAEREGQNVCRGFKSENERKPQVNHKDFNVSNNRMWNLEWVTDEENKAYSQKYR